MASAAATRARASVLNCVSIFVVEIGGRRISAGRDAMVTEFTYDEKEKSSSECTVVLFPNDGKAIPEAVKGAPMRVRWGEPAQLSAVTQMKIHSVDPKYSAQGYQLTVVGRDLGHEMGKFPKQTIYENTTLGHIVEQIARRNGLEPKLPRNAQGDINGTSVTRTVPYNSRIGRAAFEVTLNGQVPESPAEGKLLKQLYPMIQGNQTDRELLHWIAHRVGCEVHVDGTDLIFKPAPYAASPALVFRWRDGKGVLLDFNVKAGNGGHQESPARGARAAGIDPLTGQPFTTTANDGSTPGRPVLGKTSPFGGVNSDGAPPPGNNLLVNVDDNGQVIGTPFASGSGPEGAVIPTPSGRLSDAKMHSTAMHAEGEGGGLKASATILGIATVRRRQVHQFVGIESAHAGKYLVTECSHKLGTTSYLVTMGLKRQGQNAGKQKKTAGKSNESKPGDPSKAQNPMFLVDENGQIIGQDAA